MDTQFLTRKRKPFLTSRDDPFVHELDPQVTVFIPGESGAKTTENRQAWKKLLMPFFRILLLVGGIVLLTCGVAMLVHFLG